MKTFVVRTKWVCESIVTHANEYAGGDEDAAIEVALNQKFPGYGVGETIIEVWVDRKMVDVFQVKRKE